MELKVREQTCIKKLESLISEGYAVLETIEESFNEEYKKSEEKIAKPKSGGMEATLQHFTESLPWHHLVDDDQIKVYGKPLIKSKRLYKSKDLRIHKRVVREVDKFNNMQRITLGENAQQISNQDYIEYILKNGTNIDKRQFLDCLEGYLQLKQGEVNLI